MTWLTEGEGDTPLERVLRKRPDLHALLRDFVARVWSERLVDPVILELCRLRIAGLHRCGPELRLRYRPALDAGLTEDKIAALPSCVSSDLFSDRERACIRLAEQFATDPHLVTDDDFDEVARRLSAQETTALVCALAVFDGMARLRTILAIDGGDGEVVVVPTPDPANGPLF